MLYLNNYLYQTWVTLNVIKLCTTPLLTVQQSSGHKTHDHYPLWYTSIQLLAVFLPMCTTEAQRGNSLNTWSGIREQNTFALRSHMGRIQRQTMGFLKVLCGSETYGLAWCYVTLNPHHLPGGPGVQSLPASNRIQHHWSSVIHGFLISPPSLPLFQLPDMHVYK